MFYNIMDSRYLIEALEKWNFWHQDIETGIRRTKYLKEALRLIKVPEMKASPKGVGRSGG